MPRLKAPTDETLKKAARLRAGGSPWQDVRKELGLALSTVCHWPKTYRVKWDAFYAIATQEILTEASAESVHVLRQQLRSEDEHASRDAAGKLIRTRQHADAAADPPASPEVFAFAHYLEGLSDADLSALIARLAPRLGFTRLVRDDAGDPPRSAA